MAQNFIFINKNSLLDFHATQRIVLALLHKQRNPITHHPSNNEFETHSKTLFEMPMALSLNSGSFPSSSNVSATFSFWIHSGKLWNPTKFNADMTGRTNLDKSVW